MTDSTILIEDPVAVESHYSMRGIVWRQFRRHPAALVALTALGVVVVASIFAFLSPYDPNEINLTDRWASPSLEHPFGTDKLGRDLFTRILYGGRISLIVGFVAMAGSVLLGVLIGGFAGFFGGTVDSVLMRFTDFALIFPQIFVLLFLSAILSQLDLPLLSGDLSMIIFVIAVTSWMIVARLVRASFLAVRGTEFITAARSYGAGSARLLTVHILPNSIGPILVAASRGVAGAILIESGLSFLGYGIQPPTASWGNILQDAFTTMGSYPWLTFFPGFMIFVTVLSLSFIGDALRDALDPFKVTRL